MGKYSNVDVSDIRTSLKATLNVLTKISKSTDNAYDDLNSSSFKNSTPINVSAKILKGIGSSTYKGSVSNVKKLVNQILKSLTYIEKYQEEEKKNKQYKSTVEKAGDDASTLDEIKLKNSTNNLEKYERLIDNQLKKIYNFRENSTSGKNGSTTYLTSSSYVFNSSTYVADAWDIDSDDVKKVLSNIKTKITNYAQKAKSAIKQFLKDILWQNDPTIPVYDDGSSTSTDPGTTPSDGSEGSSEGIADKPEVTTTTTTGASVTIPSSISQTGIIADFTQNYGTRGWSGDQSTLRQAWLDSGSTADGNLCIYNGRYLVAVGDGIYGNIGDNIDIELDDGTIIPATIADVKKVKSSSSTDYNSGYYGHIYGGQESIVEFQATNTSQTEVTSNLKLNGFYGKTVKSVTNVNHNVLTNSDSTAINGMISSNRSDTTKVDVVVQSDSQTTKAAATSTKATDVSSSTTEKTSTTSGQTTKAAATSTKATDVSSSTTEKTSTTSGQTTKQAATSTKATDVSSSTTEKTSTTSGQTTKQAATSTTATSVTQSTPTSTSKYSNPSGIGVASTCTSAAAKTIGVVTTDNKTYTVGSNISQAEYQKMIAVVCVESKGGTASAQLAVASTVLNSHENSGLSINKTLNSNYIQWEDPPTDYENYLTRTSDNASIYDAAKAAVDSALSGTRNVGQSVVFFNGNGKNNYFSDKECNGAKGYLL